MANKLYTHRFLVSLFSLRYRCFSETPLSRFVDTMSCNKNTVTLFTCHLSSPRNSFLNVLKHDMQISIHLNLFTWTPFFDCLPLFLGSGMKPKVPAAEWRSPRPWLYEICSSSWTTLRRHRQSDGEETENCSRKNRHRLPVYRRE